MKYCVGSARFIPTIPYQSHCSRVKIITMKYSFLCFCVSIISGHCGCDDHVMMGRLETSSCICLNHISPAWRLFLPPSTSGGHNTGLYSSRPGSCHRRRELDCNQSVGGNICRVTPPPPTCYRLIIKLQACRIQLNLHTTLPLDHSFVQLLIILVWSQTGQYQYHCHFIPTIFI